MQKRKRKTTQNIVLVVSSQDPSAMPRPTSQDLAGFWDLLQLSIDDVTAKFDELQQIKNNQWQLVESPEKKVQLVPVCPDIRTFMIVTINLSYTSRTTQNNKMSIKLTLISKCDKEVCLKAFKVN